MRRAYCFLDVDTKLADSFSPKEYEYFEKEGRSLLMGFFKEPFRSYFKDGIISVDSKYCGVEKVKDSNGHIHNVYRNRFEFPIEYLNEETAAGIVECESENP